MIIKSLRTEKGITNLKGNNSWNANDPGVKIEALACGGYAVTQYGIKVRLTGMPFIAEEEQVVFPPSMTSPGTEQTDLMVEHLKRGPGRPPKSAA